MPYRESSGFSPGPQTSSSTIPLKGLFQTGLLIQDVISPPPKMIFKPGLICLMKPIMANVHKAWLKKFRENPTREGFSFSKSPFGEDPFDLWAHPNDLKYQDVFTGFVFYLPLDRHKLVTGIQGILNEAYRKELKRRWAIVGEPYTVETESSIEKELGIVTEIPYPKLDIYLKDIDQWVIH